MERCHVPTPSKVLIIVSVPPKPSIPLYPYYRVQEEGIEPVVAAPEKRRYQMVMHEVKPGWTITKEWEGYSIEANVAFKDVDPNDYLGIMFSGGKSGRPVHCRYDKDLVRITRHFFETGKPIASVCHGVEIPAYAGCVKGRRMATVAKCQFDLEVCGGIYVNEPCVIDGNLISGRTFHDNGKYLGAWIKLLLRCPGKPRARGFEDVVFETKCLNAKGRRREASVGSASADAVAWMKDLNPGFDLIVPENASAKAGPYETRRFEFCFSFWWIGTR